VSFMGFTEVRGFSEFFCNLFPDHVNRIGLLPVFLVCNWPVSVRAGFGKVG
jgi:hypothetical protein